MVDKCKTRMTLALFGLRILSVTVAERWHTETVDEATEVTSQPATAAEAKPLLFLVNTLFLHDCFTALTKTEDEDLHVVTGSIADNIRTLERIIPLRLSSQSTVGAETDEQSVVEQLIQLNRFGLLPLGYFHSHPGCGPGETEPSSTDRSTQAAFEKAGSQIIGGIFSRDGFVRFYANDVEPNVRVVGEGVKEIEKNVFQLALGKNL